MSKFYKVAEVLSYSFFKKLLVAMIICFGIFSSAQAQISVTATAGVVGPSPYTTLKLAFDAINAGTHQGVISITVTGTSTESGGTAVLNTSALPSAYTSVSIRPTAPGALITGNIASAIIKLNGADNVTIDGFVGAGPARDLSFSNTSAAANTAVIWVASASASNSASGNIIRNTIITGNGSTTTLVALTQSSGTTIGGLAETANSNNTYTNNLVSQAQYGIGVVGASGNEDANTVINGNTVTNLGHAGLFISTQKDIVVSKNIINNVYSSLGSFIYQTSGIFVGGSMTRGLIEKNTISNIRITSFWGCNGIQLDATNTGTNLVIANNFIYDIAAGGYTTFDTVDDNGCGIAVDAGGGYAIRYNSIDLSTNQSGGGITAAIWVAQTMPAGAVEMRNNIFSNRQTTATRYAIYSNTANTVFSLINYNDYFSAGSVGFLGGARASLTNWQTASGQDANSVNVNPLFNSTVNLHLLGNSPLDGLATPIAGITSDFDDESRNVTTPDIGADEFTPPNCAGSLGGTATATTLDICASGSAILSSSGYSFGLGISYQWETSPNGSTGWVNLGAGQTNPLSGNTGVISVTTYYRLRVSCTFTSSTGYSNVVTITVNNPAVTGPTGGSRCGTGTVNLSATGANLKWYTASTGGVSIAAGSPFTTPVISATTTFYVSNSTGGVSITGGKPSTAGPDGGYNGTDAGLVFDCSQAFTLTSVLMYPQAAGDIVVQLLTSTGTLIASQNVTFTAAGATVVPLGFAVPVGTSHRIIISSNPSSIAIWRDFTGNTYPYALGTVGSITGGYISGAVGTYYFFYNWQITTACESTRTPITATVTAPPAFTTVSPAPGAPSTICGGSSVTLNAVGGGYTTYTWNPGNLPNGSVVSPTTTTSYTLTANVPPNGCRRDSVVTITVNAAPTPLTISPSTVSICPNLTYSVSTSGGLIPGQSIFTELAEVFPLTKFTQTGSGVVLGQSTTYYQQGTSSIRLTHGDFSDGSIESINIPLTGYTNPSLTFYHIAGLEATTANHYDVGYVEYNIGSGWVQFPSSAYTGSGTLVGAVVGFDRTSYTDWNAQFTSAASTPGTAPATALWKQETINLSSLGTPANFKIRFHLITDVSIQYYGWLIDNIKITGTGQAPITWNNNANLYTTSGLGTNVPVNSGNYPTVFYNTPVNAGAVTYTATASSGGSCTSTANVTISATGATPSVSISASPAGPICAGTSVTFTATPVNGGAGAAYNWRVNGASVSGGSQVGMTTIILSSLANGNSVTCDMSVVPNVCFPGGTLVSSAAIVMTVNPKPTANPITGSTGSTVCNGTPNLLTEVATGTITTHQWLLNGSPVGGNSSTYSATLPGTYTVAIVSNLGCVDTSAAFVVTLPTYTITATAGANGTISPSGAVVVNCGDNQTFTITPNGGYAIQDVTVDGLSVGALATYTFTNVIAPHTINATFFISGCASPATSNAGPDVAICGSINHTLAGSIGGSATSGTWSTSGTGTFNPNTTFSAATSYTPSAADIAAGTVNLTITTNIPGAPCIASMSTMTLTLKKVPAVTITGQIGICTSGATSTYLVADTSATTVNITTFQWSNGSPIGTNNDSVLVSSTGNYNVTVTAVNGCTKVDAVVVNILAPPTLTIAGTGPICTDAAVDINATANAGSGTVQSNGFKWYRNGVLIVGATTSVLSATQAGTYTATATNSNGCVSTTLSNSVVLAADNGPLNGNYTISAGLATCTNYLSFAKAIKDLNTRGISGNVRFNIDGGYIETAPSGGLILGSAILNPQTATGKTITFQKSSAGANPKITAFTGGANTPTTAIPDGIWKLRGVDNVSIIQIDLAENSLNSGNALMEFGYGLFRFSATDGAQNNTIQNCTITLNKANDVLGSGSTTDGATGIFMTFAVDTTVQTQITPTSVAGANSFNKFYGNTIQNCHSGIGLLGYTAPSPYTFADIGNEIGGTTATTGNTILNFGNAGNASAPVGIRVINQYSSNISFNTVNNNNGAGSNSTNVLRGIYLQSALTADATINNNTVTLNSGSTGSNTIGIDNSIGSTGVTNLVNINSNSITGSNTSGNAAGAIFTGILNTATPANLTISANIINNVTLSGPGAFTGISNTAVVANFNVNNNTISGNTKSSTGVLNGIIVGGPAVAVIQTNTISNNTITGGAAACTLNCVTVATTTTGYTFDGNSIINNSITAMSGSAIATLYGFYNNSSPIGEVVSNNVIRKLFITGTSTGLHILRGLYNNTTSNAANFRNVIRNQVDSLYSDANSSAAISGIFSGVGNNVTISNNKIHSLFPGQSATAGSFAKGILINSGTRVKIANNMISLDFTQAFLPAANNRLTANNAVCGIEKLAGSSADSIYYNTIRLAGGGSGSGFGSSAMSIFINTGSVEMRNNIFANLMTPGGTSPGLSVALRRTTATLPGNWFATSNYNLWYTTQTASTPLFYNGSAQFNTLALFRTNVTPREAASIDDLPIFVNVAQNDLHLASGGNCNIDGAGIAIPNYNDDYDAVGVRDPNAPDIGADEYDGTGGSGTWKGINTDWMDPRNWCGVVPTVTTDVIIPVKPSGIYPIITTAAPVARNMTISTGASITINAAGQLSNKGSWLNNGTLTNNGTIELNGTSNQAFPGVAGTGTLAAMTNLNVNNAGGATIDKSIRLFGTLKPVAGAITINTGVVVTLHSDLSGTARVDALGGSASFVYNGTGKFSVERYISSGTRTAWRFLSAPIGGTETIRQAWMEGQTAGSYTSTGYGMQIVGPGGTGVGFDINNTITSLKTYNPATGTWVSVSGTNIAISTTQGYMAFIRGDRGSNTFGAMSPTTLRMSGPIKTGVVGPLSTATANGFISVGNPYPSAIDFTTTTRNGLLNTYYLWDPKLGSYGGYQTFSAPGYTASPGGGSYSGANNSIESGQAFFVVATAAAVPHDITLGESNKVAGGFQVARTAYIGKQLSTRLYLISGGNASLYDGNRVDFDPSYSNDIDDNDAPKLNNFGENIGLLRNGKTISIERRADIVNTDTIFYQFGQLRQQAYQLEFTPENLANPALTAYLEDAYLATSTAIAMDVATTINFTVNADAASKATDRFRLVFKQLGPVPVTFSSVTAERQVKNIQVKWRVENETNIAQYLVERSGDGRSFQEIGIVAAMGNGNGTTLNYSYLDQHTLAGNNFYRIRSVSANGEKKLSQVVKVNMTGDPAMITVFPNPVKEDGIVNVSMTNQPKGTYLISVVNSTGQTILKKVVNHEGANSVYNIKLAGTASHINYVLQVSEGNKVKTSVKILF